MDKWLGYINRIRAFLDWYDETKAPLNEVGSIHGTVYYIFFSGTGKTPHTSQLQNFLGGFKN
jgi:hypothetical protein